MTDSALKGIRVLDFTQVIAGSYGTTLLGDLGATVVKVEPPVHGDSLRFAGPMFQGESGFFLLNNRNKKSISVDIKRAEGVELVKALIPHFDVLAENFTPGVMERLGLGYEEARRLRPDIIYSSVSGYGQEGAYARRPAYDNIIQGESGLAALNGHPEDGRPLRSPLSVSDYTAAIYSGLAIVTALFHRQRTGKGQRLEVAMLDSLVSIMDNSFLIYELHREAIRAAAGDRREHLEHIGLKSSGNRHPGAAPHGFYRTADGYVAHMSLSNAMWHRLLRIIGREDVIGDPRYEKLDQRKSLWRETDDMIERWTRQHTTKDVRRIFEESGLPCGEVRTVNEISEDEHCLARGIFHEVEHPVAGKVRITNVPTKMSETPPSIRAPSPLLGQHNYDVLHQYLGYTDQQVRDLVDRGVLYEQRAPARG